MGYFFSPKIFLFFVFFTDAWIFSRGECPVDQEFCKAIQSCTSRKKCEDAFDKRGYPTGMPSRHTPPECPEGQDFCYATRGCTIREKCEEALADLGFPTGMPSRHTPPECPKGQEFCKAIQGCTTWEKCEAALAERGYPTGMPSRHTPPECPEGQNFCYATRGCTTREKCEEALADLGFPTGMPSRHTPPECPEGQNFCYATRGCTTREKCEEALADLGFPTGMPSRHTPPECPEGQNFCYATRGCTTREKCEEALADLGFPTGMPSRHTPPECPEGQNFCYATRGCTTRKKCEEALADLGFPTGMPSRHTPPECPEGQNFCYATRGCTTREKCEEALADLGFPTGMPSRHTPPECPEGQEFCYVTKGCTTWEKCEAALAERGYPTGMPSRHTPPECPKGQEFCRAIKSCTTQEKCEAASAERRSPTGMPSRHTPPECPEGQEFCRAIKSCTTQEKCEAALAERRSPTGMASRRTPPECPEGQEFCKAIKSCTTQEKCEAALAERRSPTGMPSRRTPPECPEGQEFCRAIKSCTTRENCEAGLDERRYPTGMPSRHTPPECPEGEKPCLSSEGLTCVAEDEKCDCIEGRKYCESVRACVPKEMLQNGQCPPACKKPQIYCPTSGECSKPTECEIPHSKGPGENTKSPRNKDDYFFAGEISANIAEAACRGYNLGNLLKKLRFKVAALEGVLGNVVGRWQVMKSTLGTRIKPTWSNMEKGTKISPKDSIRFMPANSSVHGFEGIELKINDVSKYIGVIILPCIVPEMKVKKELSGEEEKPINFIVKDVFDVTRKFKVLVSNLEEEYNEFIPQTVLDKYRKMLTGGSLGQHLGIMVKSIGLHRLMEQREESEDDSNEKILPITPNAPKIFALESKLVLRPAKDVSGVIKVMIFPVDLPPGTKDILNACGVGRGMELIINVANVNDRPSPKPIDPKNPDRLRLIVEAPPLPYNLTAATNKGFDIGKFASKAGFDVDKDTLGIGIVQAGLSEIGQWQYSDDGNVWQDIRIATNISKKGTVDGEEAEILFLTPGQKIRFQPSQLNNVWRKRDAFKTILRFVLWDQTDNLASGLRRVALKGNDAISYQVLSVFMERFGCDGRASSGLIKNECNECGKKSCKKCDNSTDSDAVINECKICVLGNTGLGMDEGKDCRGICGGSYIMHETCNKCVPRGKRVTDCAGVCFGTTRNNRCGVCSDDKDAGADACKVCGGDNSTCTGCDGIVWSGKKIDRCGECRDPQSPEFNKGCTKLGALAPKLHSTGKKIVYKLDASGFPESGTSCNLRLGNTIIPLEVSLDPLTLTVEKVDNPGVYTLICTINDEEYSLAGAVTAFSEKISVSSAEPSEVTVGSDTAEVTVTGEGFMNSSEMFCVYDDVLSTMSPFKRSKRRSVPIPASTKRLPAKFVSSTQCKCKINTKVSKKISISVVFGKEEQNPESPVVITIVEEAIGIKGHKLNYKSKKLFITFTSAVKRLTGCSEVFKEATVEKLKELAGDRKFSCIIRKADELEVHVPGAVLREDLQLDFKADAIKAGKGFSKASQALSVIVKPPAQRILPVAVITAPKLVGSCDGIKISAKNSKNTGKRGYQCAWTVAIEGDDDESSLTSDVTADLAELRNLFSSNKCGYKIPKERILENYKYALKLVVTNQEGASEAVTHFIQRSAKEIPSVRFVTKANVFDMSKRKFVLKVKAKKPVCVDDSNLIFSWSCISHPELFLRKNDTSRLVLKREELQCDEAYEFAVNVYLNTNPELGTYLKYNLTTRSTPLKFGISGGDQVVPSNGMIKLKARATSKVTCGGQLRYIFSCVDEDGLTCLVKNKDGVREELPDIEKRLLAVKANRFVANKTYSFILRVSKGIQKVNSSVKVRISPGTPPTVRIKKPKESVKPVIAVVIKSSASTTTSFKCEGVIEAGFGYVDFGGKIKVDGEFSGERMKFNQRRLRFSLHGLAPGVEYKVKCSAYKDDTPDEIGESTTTFKVESPPEAGALSVDPAEGVSSETVHSIVASEFNSDSEMTYDISTVNKKGRRTPLESDSQDRSVDTQLPAGEDDEETVTLEVVAKNKGGKSEAVRVKVKSKAKTFKEDDFEDISQKMNDLKGEGNEKSSLSFGLAVISSAKNQDGLREKVKELQENTTKVAVNLIKQQRDEGSSDMTVFASTRNLKPQSEDTKTELTKEVSSVVDGTVDKTVKRKKRREESSERRRRAVEEDTEDDEEEEAGISISEIEDILATFENLIDTSVVNNNTAEFLQTVDSLLINMCKGLPLGETSQALSNLGILKANMNYLDDADTNFLNVSCANCSMLNQTSQVKLGSEIKEMYSEWNCSGDDELCNGLCAAMVQYPYDFITAVKSPVRLSDVLYIELKNPENQDYIPVTNLTRPALFHIPLHAGQSQTSGHKCMVWSESEEQWSTSGCEKTQAFTRDGVVYVECSCTKLGYITVHQDEDAQYNIQTSTKAATSESTTTGPKTTGKGKENHVAAVQFLFDVDYNAVIRDSETKKQFLKVVEEELATTMQVDTSMILNITIAPGSIIVNFILLAPEQNPSTSLNYSLTQLVMAINQQQFVIVVGSQQLTADNGTMSYQYKTMTNVSPDESGITKLVEDDDSKLPIILGAVFGVLLIVAIIGGLLFRRHLAQQAKVSHHDVSGNQNPTTAQNTSYQGSVANNMGRPGTPGNAAPVEVRHSSGASRGGSGGVRETAQLPNID